MGIEFEPTIFLWEAYFKPWLDWASAKPPKWRVFKYIRWLRNAPKEG